MAHPCSEAHQSKAAEERAQRWEANEPCRGRLEAFGELDERGTGQTESHTAEQQFQDEPRVDSRVERYPKGVVVAETSHDQVADDRGTERWNDCLVAHTAERLHLEREDGPGDGHSEDGTETPGQRSDQQGSSVVGLQPDEAREGVGETARHLECGALPADRGSEQLRCPGSEQDHRRHPAGKPLRGFVDLLDEQRAAALGPATEEVVHPAEDEAGNGEHEVHAVVLEAEVRDAVEHGEEDPSGQSGEAARHGAEDDPSPE
uniref:Unannotated protein n=1 Tax=freshwater metagenome TaxID=449393 RepID=A0A6J7NRX9_9ZZZZ